MKTKFVAPLAVAIVALAITSGTPASAQSFNDSCGQPLSWAQRIGNRFGFSPANSYGWQQAAPNGWQNSSTLGNLWSQVRGNVLPSSSYPYNNYGSVTPANYYTGNNPYLNNLFGSNAYGSLDPNRLYDEMDRLNKEAQKIQNRLANRRLNANQVMELQNRLAQIDAQRAALNNVASTQLSGARDYLQGLLSNNSFSDPYQSYYAQDRVSQINNLLSQLGTGTGGALGSSGVLASLRSLLGF